MKLTNFIFVFLASVGLCLHAEAQLSETPFSGSFLNGANLAVSATSTNTPASTNVWIKGGISMTNGLTFTPVSGAVSLTNTAAFADVGLYANRDGSAAIGSIAVVMSGVTNASTNAITFRFATVNHGVASTSPLNQFAFLAALNGTNLVYLATNFPTAFLQGAHTLRCTAMESAAGSNGVISYLELKGYKP